MSANSTAKPTPRTDREKARRDAFTAHIDRLRIVRPAWLFGPRR